MRQIDLKSAFGTAPDSVEACIRRSLSREKEIVKMKKMKVLLIAALIAAMVCGTALAATNSFRLSELFAQNERARARVDAITQPVGQVYETDDVRIKVNEGLYSSADSAVAVALTVENKKPGEKYYLMVRNFTVNGEILYGGGQDTQFLEALLEDEALSCGSRRELKDFYSEKGDVNVAFDYIILRVTGQILGRDERIALRDLQEREDGSYEAKVLELTQAGYIVFEDDMIVEMGEAFPEIDYAEALIASGNFEFAGRLHISVPLSDTAAGGSVYEGEKSFRFEDLELVIDRLETGAIGVPMEMRVIVNDPVKYQDYWLWVYDADNLPTKDKEWRDWAIGTGTQSDFVLREDGRYESVYKNTFICQYEMPRALEIRIGVLDSESGTIKECQKIILNMD